MTTQPEEIRIFDKSIVLNTTVEDLIAFHDERSTMPKLAPPPMFIQIIRDERTSLSEGELEFNLWFGPVPIRWIARHEPGPTEHSFADRMMKGPMAYWRHEHIFEAVDDGAKLTDRVTLAHKPGLAGIITRLLFDGIPLRILFFYRHLRTKSTLSH